MEFRSANACDMQGVAHVFHAAFPDSVAHIYGPGRTPSLELTGSLFALCLESESDGFWVAAEGDRVTGYIFAPARLSLIWQMAVSRGYLFRWTRGWFSGRYGLGWRPLRLVVANKLSFLRHAVADRHRADARILSVAVHPDFQGRGIARRLCTLATERFDRLGVERSRLEVRPWNRPAVKVYTDLGFERVGSMSDTQGDWWIMLRRHTAGPGEL